MHQRQPGLLSGLTQQRLRDTPVHLIAGGHRRQQKRIPLRTERLGQDPLGLQRRLALAVPRRRGDEKDAATTPLTDRLAQLFHHRALQRIGLTLNAVGLRELLALQPHPGQAGLHQQTRSIAHGTLEMICQHRFQIPLPLPEVVLLADQPVRKDDQPRHQHCGRRLEDFRRRRCPQQPVHRGRVCHPLPRPGRPTQKRRSDTVLKAVKTSVMTTDNLGQPLRDPQHRVTGKTQTCQHLSRALRAGHVMPEPLRAHPPAVTAELRTEVLAPAPGTELEA
ncbi:hypothetical protein GCM10010378_29610 [Streptomyces viridochromogenes]